MDKKQAGKLGGQTWSVAKANASQVNGKLGGRPRRRTLAQVLRRKGSALQVAFYKLPPRVRGKLARHWGSTWHVDWLVGNFDVLAAAPATKCTKAVQEGIAALLKLAKG